MADREKKRSRAQAIEIARILRKRHVPPEAEAMAKAQMAKLNAARRELPKPEALLKPDVLLAGDAEPDNLMEIIRKREGISLAQGDFTDQERDKARAVLDKLMMRYAPKH
jgi:hypothetical protein